LVAACWNKFPARVAIHWGIRGNPDGWADRGPGLLFLPILNIWICGVMLALPRLDPRLRRMAADGARSSQALAILRLAVTGMLAFVSLLIAITALGFHFDMVRLLMNGVLLLFLVLGNFLGNIRQNYTAGIRTPWTLEDAEVWRETHRLGGRILVLGSLVLLVAQMYMGTLSLLVAFLAFVLGYVTWGFLYSYLRFRARHPHGAGPISP